MAITDIFCQGARKDNVGRNLWDNRFAFVCAAVGSAVGLGNIWRFPWLSYKHGGGAFFLPYLLALFFIGIPLLILEFSLGQTFRSGDIVAFGSINKRMRGVGLASVYASFMVVIYYCLIIAWAVVYAVNAFRDPLPWTYDFAEEELNKTWYASNTDVMDVKAANDAINATIRSTLWNYPSPGCGEAAPVSNYEVATGYFFTDIIKIGAEENLTAGKMVVSTYAAMVFTWICIFVSIYRGPSFTSKVVYWTMGIPVLTIIIMFFVSISLKGSEDGIHEYIGKWDFDNLESNAWTQAVSQIFFSIGVTFGIMTAYASYNNPHQNTVIDACIVSISDSLVSFVAGFAIFAMMGNVSHVTGIPMAELRTSGPSMVFITYPVGLSRDGGAGAGFMCFLFFLTLFFLGIDSAFSMVEAVSTALHDSRHYSNKVSRTSITLALCVIALLLGTVYASDTGLYMLDVVDHYLNNVTMVFVGLLECYTVGYLAFLAEQAAAIGMPAIVLFQLAVFGGSFLGPLIAMINWSAVVDCDNCVEGTKGPCTQINSLLDECGKKTGEFICWAQVDGECAYGLDTCRKGNEWGVGLAVGLGWFIVFTVLAAGTAITYKPTDGKSYSAKDKLWYLFMFNTEKLRNDILNPVVGKDGKMKIPMVWGILIKLVIPPALMIVLVVGIMEDIIHPYEGYSGGYQAAGVGVALFGVSMALYCMVWPEALDPLMPEGHKEMDVTLALNAGQAITVEGKGTQTAAASSAAAAPAKKAEEGGAAGGDETPPESDEAEEEEPEESS